MKPIGSPPTQATLRAASRTASAPPVNGSSAAMRPWPSSESGEAAHRRAQPEHRGVEPRPPNRSRSHELVVAPEHELAAAQRRRTEELEERLVRGRRVDDLALGGRRAARLRDLVARALVREQPRRDLADDLVRPRTREARR